MILKKLDVRSKMYHICARLIRGRTKNFDCTASHKFIANQIDRLSRFRENVLTIKRRQRG